MSTVAVSEAAGVIRRRVAGVLPCSSDALPFPTTKVLKLEAMVDDVVSASTQLNCASPPASNVSSPVPSRRPTTRTRA